MNTGTLDRLLGRLIKAHRTEVADCSQVDLAARVNAIGVHGNWTAATVAAIETGRRNIKLDELSAVCGAFGVSVSDLLADAGDTASTQEGRAVTRLLDPRPDVDRADYGAFVQEQRTIRLRRLEDTMWKSLERRYPTEQERVTLRTLAACAKGSARDLDDPEWDVLWERDMRSQKEQRAKQRELAEAAGHRVPTPKASSTDLRRHTQSLLADIRQYLDEFDGDMIAATSDEAQEQIRDKGVQG